jgi:hypothetical protein
LTAGEFSQAGISDAPLFPQFAANKRRHYRRFRRRRPALRFARAGAKLALIARDPAALDDVKRRAEKLGATALAVPADVADGLAIGFVVRGVSRRSAR